MAVVAYLDPGAGGLIASTAAAGLAGAAVVARSSWMKAKGKLKRGKGTEDTGTEADTGVESVEPVDATDPA
jgi:hypothetical protein